jgi:hypothetical protein
MMKLIITVNIKQIHNVAIIDVITKVIMGKIYISIVITLPIGKVRIILKMSYYRFLCQ